MIVPDSMNNFEGIIESPNYGYTYFPNLDCTWILNISTEFNLPLLNSNDSLIESQYRQNLILLNDKKIIIEFIDFDVPSTVSPFKDLLFIEKLSNNCYGDYVKVKIVFCFF